MKTAAVAVLKARLSEYLACVKRGEEVIVTERGKPIARVSPIEIKEGEDARRMRLIREGKIRPRKQEPTAEWVRSLREPVVNVPRETILRIIEEDREER